jgi:hypothetical protein
MTQWNGIKVGGLYKMSGEERWIEGGYLPRAHHLLVVGIAPPKTGRQVAVVTLLTAEGVLTASSSGLKDRGLGFNEVDFDALDGDWNGEWSRYVEVA